MDYIFDYDWVDVLDDEDEINDWIMNTINRILFPSFSSVYVVVDPYEQGRRMCTICC